MATIVAEEPLTTDSVRANPGRQTLVWPWALGLVLLTIGSYANSLRAPYLFDDEYFFERDVTYRSVERALASSTPRRLGVLTFALDYRVHRLSPIGCHLLNVTIHATAGLLLLGLVRRTLNGSDVPSYLSERANTLAVIVAAVWLVHPLQTSAVTYVIQRFESLMGLWFLLALYALARGATSPRATLWYLLALCADWLGVQTKEVSAVLPVVALAYDRIFLSRDWREMLRRRGWVHAGFVACSVWMVYEIRWAFNPNQPSSAGLGTPGVTPWEYLGSQGGVILHYLRLSFWPDRLCLDYRWPVARTAAAIYVPGAIILGLLILTLGALWRRPKVGFLGLAFFVILAPTSSLMPIIDLAFEHRMYLPLAGVIGFVVVAGAWLVERASRSWPAASVAGMTCGAIVVTLLAARTVVRNADYADAIRMWQSNVAARPTNSRAVAQLGFALLERGRVVEAERQFLRAAELQPRAYWTLMGLGRVRFKQERYDEAADFFQEARLLTTTHSIACEYLARIEERREQWSRAAELYREAVTADPNYESLRLGLARVCLKSGDSAAGADALRGALERNPRSRDARRMLAEILATAADDAVRNGAEAVALAEALAAESNSTNAKTLDLLAAAYAAAGRFDDAIRTADRALTLPADAATRLRLRERLKSYREGNAVYESAGENRGARATAGP